MQEMFKHPCPFDVIEASHAVHTKHNLRRMFLHQVPRQVDGGICPAAIHDAEVVRVRCYAKGLLELFRQRLRDQPPQCASSGTPRCAVIFLPQSCDG
eukprot:7941799-Pyramimonas_sp.AAC.1